MLERILRSINNWFLTKNGAHVGIFTISGGSIDPASDLLDGQYYRIIGSVFNDGLHQHPASDLTDETFTGAVWALAIPPDVVEIAKEAEDWEAKYGTQAVSPYTSETVTGAYSYTKGENGASTVEEVFAERLKPYRKMPGLGIGVEATRPRTPEPPEYRNYYSWR
jgi:hypothetical protein